MSELPEPPINRYLMKYARANMWRLARWMDFDDVVQTGYAAFYETRMRYPDAKDPAHVMSLFKLVLRSRIEDLVREHTRQIDEVSDDIEDILAGTKRGGVPHSVWFEDYPVLLLMKAPPRIKAVLSLFANLKSREELCRPFRVYADGRRETLNERLCRMLDVDPSRANVVKDVRAYFTAS